MQTINLIHSSISKHAIDFAIYTRDHLSESPEKLYTQYCSSGHTSSRTSSHMETPQQPPRKKSAVNVFAKTSCKHVFKRGNKIGKKCNTETKNTDFCSKHRIHQNQIEMNKDEKYRYDLMQLLGDDDEIDLKKGVPTKQRKYSDEDMSDDPDYVDDEDLEDDYVDDIIDESDY